MTAFVDAATISIGKNGGFFGNPPFDMGNVGQGVHDEELNASVRSVVTTDREGVVRFEYIYEQELPHPASILM